MSKLTIASWNVNGIRSISKKGFFDWMSKEKPKIVCIQETKISGDQLTDELTLPKGYVSYWSHAEKRGYSGVATYTKEKPLEVTYGMAPLIGKKADRFDKEGRMVAADYGDFLLLNVYFPNGKKDSDRLQYKMDYYDAFLEYALKAKKLGKKIIVCGDFNTAHKEIDLARPKENVNESGFLPIERAWMDKFVKSGHIDTFREYNNDPHNYTWWHMRTAARERNVGWRIDYFFIAEALKNNIIHATITPHIQGSDHCPVTLDLKV